MKTLLGALVMIAAGGLLPAAHAGVTDLEIQLQGDLDGPVQAGQTGQMLVTVINHGPDPAGTDPGDKPRVRIAPTYPVPGTAFSDLQPEIKLTLNAASNNTCDLVLLANDGISPTAFFYSLEYPVIAVNQSITCLLDYHIQFPTGSRLLYWRSRVAFGDDDPEPDNNLSQTISYIAHQVPGLRVVSVIVLAGLLLLAGLWRGHRRQTGG